MKKLLLTIVLMISSTLCFASSYTLLTSDAGRNANPNSSAEELFIDMVKEVFERADMTLKVQQEPWIRAQQKVRRAEPRDRLLIAPLTKTEGREGDFDWLLPLATFKLRFVTNDPSLDLANMEKLKNESVCVYRESPAEFKLKEMAFPDILSRVQVRKCYKGLKQGKIKVVLAHGERAAKAFYKQVNGKPEDLVIGRPFSEHTVYLASAKATFSDALKQRLRNAWDEMNIDGTVDKINAKYQ